MKPGEAAIVPSNYGRNSTIPGRASCRQWERCERPCRPSRRLVRDERYGTREAMELLAGCFVSFITHERCERPCRPSRRLEAVLPGGRLDAADLRASDRERCERSAKLSESRVGPQGGRRQQCRDRVRGELAVESFSAQRAQLPSHAAYFTTAPLRADSALGKLRKALKSLSVRCSQIGSIRFESTLSRASFDRMLSNRQQGVVGDLWGACYMSVHVVHVQASARQPRGQPGSAAVSAPGSVPGSAQPNSAQLGWTASWFSPARSWSMRKFEASAASQQPVLLGYAQITKGQH